jgi:biotin transporter BioY
MFWVQTGGFISVFLIFILMALGVEYAKDQSNEYLRDAMISVSVVQAIIFVLMLGNFYLERRWQDTPQNIATAETENIFAQKASKRPWDKTHVEKFSKKRFHNGPKNNVYEY